jgi:hypothetical protein
VLVVDAANVVGSRPDGWWRDRAKAAANLCRQLDEAIAAGRLEPPVVVVLEGGARGGVVERDEGGVQVVHAPAGGDDRIVELAEAAVAGGHRVTVVTADRELRDRSHAAGADVVGPNWLLDRSSTPARDV